jgi:hypothetical protein
MNKPVTQLMTNPMIESTVESIIATLKHIDIDGETMEYILHQVGMDDQMLRQLIMNSPESDIKYWFEEKIYLSDQRIDSLNKK